MLLADGHGLRWNIGSESYTASENHRHVSGGGKEDIYADYLEPCSHRWDIIVNAPLHNSYRN